MKVILVLQVRKIVFLLDSFYFAQVIVFLFNLVNSIILGLLAVIIPNYTNYTNLGLSAAIVPRQSWIKEIRTIKTYLGPIAH